MRYEFLLSFFPDLQAFRLFHWKPYDNIKMENVELPAILHHHQNESKVNEKLLAGSVDLKLCNRYWRMRGLVPKVTYSKNVFFFRTRAKLIPKNPVYQTQNCFEPQFGCSANFIGETFSFSTPLGGFDAPISAASWKFWGQTVFKNR